MLDAINHSPDLTILRSWGNRGDDLIYAGMRNLLRDRAFREYDIRFLGQVPTGHTAVISGGGAWCKPFHAIASMLPAVEERFSRVIVFPSSFDIEEPVVLQVLLRTRATIFARERYSYEQIRHLCEARLAHDTAFFFDFNPYRTGPQNGVLNAFREDAEATGAQLPESNRDISNECSSMDEWLWTISRHELIRTDRAHVVIAGAMLGRQVEYRPSSYHKVPAIVEFSIPPNLATPIREGNGPETTVRGRAEPAISCTIRELHRELEAREAKINDRRSEIDRLTATLAIREEELQRAGQIGVLESELRRASADLLDQCETGGRLGAELAARTEAGERLETELAAKEQDRARLTAETERAAGQIGALESELHRVSAALLDRRESVGRLGAELDHRTAELQRLSADMAAITASHRDRLQTCVAQIEELNRAVSDKDNRVSSLKRETADASSRLQVREYELSRTVAELEASRHAVRALRRSWSWRLSAPLRAVVDLLIAARRLLRGTGRGMSLRSKALRYLQWLRYSRQVRASGLFDESYYLSHNPDVAQSKSDPLRHFFFFGGAELRNPHPLFDLHYYCGRNPDVAKSSVNPLVHYLKWGASEGRDPHPDFDTSFYLDRYPDVREAGVNPLVHFMGPGVPQGLDPNPWFDTSEYLDCNPNVALKGVNPLVHHLEHREAEWRRQRMESSENAPQVLPAASGGSLGLPLGMRIDPRTTELRAGLRAEYERSERPPLDSEYDAVPLVSVVIPCYNYGYYLEDAILSAMMACSYPMEILVVDDGSTDEGSLAAVEDLAGRYHFRLLRQKNTGQTGARNNGVRNSHGKFIQFLDADDLLAPSKIDFQVDMMTYDRGIDIAVCEYELCDADGEGRRSMAPSTLAGFAFNAEDFLLRWERGFSLAIHCALFRREVLDPEQFQCITKAGKEDWIFWIVVASKSPRFHFHPDVLAIYRIHGHNTFTNREGMGIDFLRACMYVLQAGLNRCDNFLEESIDHFRKAYLGSIKHEAIVSSRTHATD